MKQLQVSEYKKKNHPAVRGAPGATTGYANMSDIVNAESNLSIGPYTRQVMADIARHIWLIFRVSILYRAYEIN